MIRIDDFQFKIIQLNSTLVPGNFSQVLFFISHSSVGNESWYKIQDILEDPVKTSIRQEILMISISFHSDHQLTLIKMEHPTLLWQGSEFSP